jgi:hypothetical protein
MTQNEKAITGMNIRSEVNAYDNFNYDQPKAEELLKAGFGVAHVQDGIARGTGSLIAEQQR